MPTFDPFAAVMREERWDAVVIGAGPAGAVAARQLARQGKRVLLVEKSRLPRDKVCGGCLGGAALEALASIGLGDLPERGGGMPLSTFALANAGTIARVPIGRRIALSRRTFDAELVCEAARAGAVVCDQTVATIEDAKQAAALPVALRHHSGEASVAALVVIVATGLSAALPGSETFVSPRSRIGIGAILKSAPCAMDAGALHMAVSDAGYVGITAVEDGQYDMAAAVDPYALASAESPGHVVHNILQEAGWEPAIDLSKIKWRGTPLLTRRTRPVGRRRRLLVGDAAGYVEPFTGEGIGWAVHSAILAASLLTGSLEVWDDTIAERWTQLYEKSLARSQQSCRVLSQLLRVRPLRRLMTWGIGQAPMLSRPIVRRLDRGLAAPLT